MTALTMNATTTHSAGALPVGFEKAAGDKQTRKSIKKYFPLGQIMSKGQNNPITLHSVNEDVFPRMWSFMAEVMIVDGELPRSVKEEVALLVSTKNQCPMCVTAHRMMGEAAKRAEQSSKKAKQMSDEEKEQEEKLYLQVMDYAELIIVDTIKYRTKTQPKMVDNSYGDLMALEADDSSSSGLCSDTSNSSSSSNRSKDEPFPLLSAKAKAEVALVVVLYFHMNRIISAVLGEQMSKAMFSVPEGAAKRMESQSVMSVVNKMMAPFLAGGMKKERKPGITSSLFPQGSSCLEVMPRHLMGAEQAGEERADALARVVAWAKCYEELMVSQKIVPREVIDFLENPQRQPSHALRPSKVSIWATTEMKKLIRVCLRKEDEYTQAVTQVLCLVTYSPQSLKNSVAWQDVVKQVGEEQAKTLVVWWSLRESTKRAQGLEKPKSAGKRKSRRSSRNSLGPL